MSKPVRQHFIPRSYLNNFSETIGDKHFVFAKRTGDKKIRKYSTKDLCVEKNLYTLPIDDEAKKFDLEHFYADKIDSVFPDVYRFLKDKNNTTINFETRLKVISTCLSLYFRTPKFLNAQNVAFENIVKQIAEGRKEITINSFGSSANLSNEEATQIIKEQKENNRKIFLKQHLVDYEKFVQSKLLDNIAVYHISDDSEFITCDNPVIIRPYADINDPDFNDEEYFAQEIDPFDSKNMINLTLDNKTILTILPADNKSVSLFLQQSEIALHDVLVYNSEIERYAEQWIIGTDTSVQKHLEDQNKYNEITDDNLRMIEDYKDKVLKLNDFLKLLEKYGSKSEIVKRAIKDMSQFEYFVKDPAFQEIIKSIG